jgi:multidrug efflux pump subunit AcrA (membrane-fusion protein)
MKRIFLLLMCFSALLACGNEKEKPATESITLPAQPSVQHVVGIGKIIPEKDIIQLSLAVNGIVQKVHKKENDSVSVGTVILELNHASEDAAVARLEQEIKTQNSQIEMESASLRENRVLYAKANDDLKRLSGLFSKGAETKQNVDDAASKAESLRAVIQRAEAAVEVAKSRLLETRASLRSAQINRDQKILRSPVNGRILECDVKTGESVLALSPFVQIRPEGKTIALCEIDESYADKVVVGQRGWIRKVGTTDTLSTGTIFFAYSFLNKKSLFTDQAGEREDRRVRAIKMSLDQPDALLLNARVECVIDISETKNK